MRNDEHEFFRPDRSFPSLGACSANYIDINFSIGEGLGITGGLVVPLNGDAPTVYFGGGLMFEAPESVSVTLGWGGLSPGLTGAYRVDCVGGSSPATTSRERVRPCGSGPRGLRAVSL